MSQCDRILEVLADGKPHRMEEIHERVGTCRLNSRVSELRRRGHVITCDKSGGVYTYQLIPSQESDGVSLGVDTTPSPAGSSPALATAAGEPQEGERSTSPVSSAANPSSPRRTRSASPSAPLEDTTVVSRAKLAERWRYANQKAAELIELAERLGFDDIELAVARKRHECESDVERFIDWLEVSLAAAMRQAEKVAA